MKDRLLIGMWRYAVTKKLRKRINRAAILKLSFKLDGTQDWKNDCGMQDEFRFECPFYCRVNGKSTDEGNVQYADNHRCLAPNNDKLWHEAMKQAKQFVSPRYEKQNMVVGCYLLIFAERGLENYKRLQRWSARFRAWQLAQSKIKSKTSS